MKFPRLVLIILIVALVVPLAGCSMLEQGAISALASAAPKLTEAAAGSDQPTAESTRILRVKTSAPVKPTATAEPEATQKATARPTRRPTALPTAVPATELGGYLPVGEVILTDALNDPASGLAEYADDEYELAYRDGAYHITLYQPDMIVWANNDLTLTDFAIEVTGLRVSGPSDGDYGIIFRYQDSDNFYVFKVADDGSYAVSALVNNEWTNLLPWNTSDAIAVEQPNTIAVVAVGTMFSFYANGTLLATAVDGTFGEGDVALCGSTYDLGDLDVQFTNLSIWEVQAEAVDDVIEAGELLYSDDFSDPDSGWDVWDGESSLGDYVDGEYRITITEADALAWGNAYQYFDDAVVSVQATKLTGSDDNGFGLVLRYQDVDNFYVFAASTDGQYTFGYYQDNEWYPLVDWTPTDLVNVGDAVNELTAACQGDHFVLMINGTVVEDLTDSTFSEGDIGLMGAANSEGGIEFAYDNLNVWAAQ